MTLIHMHVCMRVEGTYHDRCLCLCNGHSSGRLHLHSCGDLLLEWNKGTLCACSLSQSSSLHMKLYVARFNSTKAREGPEDDLEIAQIPRLCSTSYMNNSAVPYKLEFTALLNF